MVERRATSGIPIPLHMEITTRLISLVGQICVMGILSGQVNAKTLQVAKQEKQPVRTTN